MENNFHKTPCVILDVMKYVKFAKAPYFWLRMKKWHMIPFSSSTMALANFPRLKKSISQPKTCILRVILIRQECKNIIITLFFLFSILIIEGNL